MLSRLRITLSKVFAYKIQPNINATPTGVAFFISFSVKIEYYIETVQDFLINEREEKG